MRQATTAAAAADSSAGPAVVILFLFVSLFFSPRSSSFLPAHAIAENSENTRLLGPKNEQPYNQEKLRSTRKDSVVSQCTSVASSLVIVVSETKPDGAVGENQIP